MKKAIKKVFGWAKRPGAFERPSQEKRRIPVGFHQPESLEAQIARIVRSQVSRVSLQKRAEQLDPEFEDLEYERKAHSPHELVFDEDTGIEMTRWEKESVDKEREAFDSKAKAYLERRKQRLLSLKKQKPEVKDEKKKASDDKSDAK